MSGAQPERERTGQAKAEKEEASPEQAAAPSAAEAPTINREELKVEPTALNAKEAAKEIDISLFPSRKRRPPRSWLDFSDVEDELLPDEYEAEEILDDFAEKEGEDFGQAEEAKAEEEAGRRERGLAENDPLSDHQEITSLFGRATSLKRLSYQI